MDPVRLGIVGIGRRGSDFVRRMVEHPNAEVVALCDHTPAKAEWAAQAHGATDAKIFGSVEELLAGSDCEAVIIASSDWQHAASAVPVLDAGRYVYIEKPLDIGVENCQAIIAADDRAGGRAFVGHNLRYAPGYVAVKKQLDAGSVGKILTLQADEFYDGGRTYFRRWNRLRSHGGGLWLTKACHDFDILYWLAQARPLDVHAVAEKSYYVPKPDAAMQCRDCALADTCPDRAPAEVHPVVRLDEEHGGTPHDLCLYNADSDTFDHGMVTIRFEGGLFACYTCNVVAGFSNRRVRVSGPKGTIDGSLTDETVLLRRRDPSGEETFPVGDTSGGHGGADTNIVDNFLSFVRGESEPKCRPREAAVAVTMGLAATRSGDENRVVRMDEFDLGI